MKVGTGRISDDIRLLMQVKTNLRRFSIQTRNVGYLVSLQKNGNESLVLDELAITSCLPFKKSNYAADTTATRQQYLEV